MDISQQEGIPFWRQVALITVLIVERLILPVGGHTLMTPHTIGLIKDSAKILFIVGGDLKRREP